MQIVDVHCTSDENCLFADLSSSLMTRSKDVVDVTFFCDMCFS